MPNEPRCIMCFLDEEFHFELRKESQSSIRHIEHLDLYKGNLIKCINDIGNACDCPKHKQFTKITRFYDDMKNSIDWSSDVLDTIDFMIKVHNCWDKGNVSQAHEMIKHYIVEHELHDNSKGKDNPFILFRARQSGGSLAKADLYHIPFNKRHLVKNQRFSLSGHPLLYLGTSIIDIIYELRCERTGLSNLQISAFAFKDNIRLDLFDLTNGFIKQLDAIYAILSDDCRIEYDDDRIGTGKQQTRRLFKKFLLMSCCSFQRLHEDGVFVEEYVLPQLLTESIRQMEFAGIKYSSSRLMPQAFSQNIFARENYPRENYVLFTSHSDYTAFDDALMENLIITDPECFSSSSIATQDDLEAAKDKIIKAHNEDRRRPLIVDIADLSSLRYSVKMGNIAYQGVKYHETDFGKFELYLIIKIMNEIDAKFN